MSARAASRLGSLGFADVRIYRGGKADWTAAGLPVEGEGRTLRARDVVRRDVTTCRLDDRLADVRARASELCVVVDADGVVLGLLGPEALAGEDDVTVAEAAAPAPATVRPSIPLERAKRWLDEQRRESFLVTTSDGKLVGVLRRKDL